MATLNMTTVNHLMPSRLWFGTCAGAAAWGMQGMLCVFIATHYCRTGYGGTTPETPTTARVLIIIVTLLALAVTVTAALISSRNWARTSTEKDPIFAEALDREAYMSLIGIALNVILGFGILCAGLPVLLLDLCARTR